MERVFSVEEVSDHFWTPPVKPDLDSSKMNRSPSEWAFQRFLQESASSPHHSPSSSSDPLFQNDNDNNNINGGDCMVSGGLPVDSEEYQELLRTKLNLACAAVAFSGASFLQPQVLPAGADSGALASSTLQLKSQDPPNGSGCDLARQQYTDSDGPLGNSCLSTTQKKPGTPAWPTTSGSSKEQSEDDENEAETEITENMDPADVKRVKRMLSNRESARRSRRRKQAHLIELETQVSQLRVENSTLLKRFTDISQKYNESAVDNRVLKADVETLRAKVKMAEETVKRITGLNQLFHPMSDVSTIDVSSFDGSPSDASADAAVPIQDEPKHQFYQPPNNHSPSHDPSVNNGLAEVSSVENVLPNSGSAETKMEGTSPMQRVASLEHLQKRIRRGVSPSGPQSNGEQQK